ncbi:MAG: TonB-dependent receptor [Dysgonamonadaceae bacterium]|jgi:outer membrane receptor protein involved in Fe transport|nr:TonB-dependent receptor [Dysgonamonadaceae bacterium]
MKHIYSVLIVFFTATNFLLAEGDTDSLSRRQIHLDEVVVQSFKYGKDFAKLPLAATTIDASTIENQQIRTVKEAVALIPNLFMPDYGSRLTSPVYIRGIGSKINSPSVGLYVDGIPYFEKSSFDFDLNEIDFIEVLRGPQGALYGRNTMGGLINVITRSPLIFRGTSAAADYGNYDNMSGQISHFGGNKNNTFGYAVSGSYSHLGGYFTNIFTGKKADELNSGNARVRLDWRVKPNLTMRLISSLDALNQGGYPYSALDSLNRTTPVNYNDYSSYARTISSSGFTVIYTTDRFSLNSQTAYQYLSDDQRIDQDFSTANQYFAIQKQKQSTVSQELTIKSHNFSPYKWLFGAFFFHQSIDNEVILEYKIPNYSTDKLYNMPTTGFSAYHQSVFDNLLVKRLSATLGLRYDYERANYDYAAYRDTTGRHDRTDAFYSTMNFGQLTPKIALQYAFTPKNNIYLSVAKGYKTGGFNTSFANEEDRSFEPEYSWNYEIGTKLKFFDDRLQADFCLFYIDWRKQQIYQPLPSGIGQMLKNAGRSESRGAEASLSAKILKNLYFQANWGYTHAVFKDYQKDANTNYSGNFLPFVPRQTITAAVDYTIPVLKRQFDRIALNINYSGVDRLYWNEDNAIKEPYYGLLNGKLSVDKGLLGFSVWAKNILCEDYLAYYFESMKTRFVQKGKPFTAGITLRVSIN